MTCFGAITITITLLQIGINYNYSHIYLIQLQLGLQLPISIVKNLRIFLNILSYFVIIYYTVHRWDYAVRGQRVIMCVIV